jgi:hypothetical protein
VLALVPATWLTAQRVFDPAADSPQQRSTDRPIPPVSPRPSPAATASASATSAVPSPTPSVTPLPRVAPDAPRRLVAGSLIDTGFDSAVTRLEAASSSEVARLETRGSPGSPGTDTVVVVGEVLTGRDSAFAALPRLRVGGTVSIRTDRGTMTYTVRAAVLQPRATLAANAVITDKMPGRLVLVGLRYAASGTRLDDALVVTAELTGARRA